MRAVALRELKGPFLGPHTLVRCTCGYANYMYAGEDWRTRTHVCPQCQGTIDFQTLEVTYQKSIFQIKSKIP
jgi:hypothetical protein